MMPRLGIVVAALALASATASAGTLFDPAAAGFQPRVPISALARPAAWFDPARLHMSSSFSVGSGLGGGTTSALQVTSFSYQYRAPVTMSVSVGNAFGPGSASRNSSFFLESLDLSYHPSANAIFKVQFRDMRSPLQYGYNSGNAADRAFWGY